MSAPALRFKDDTGRDFAAWEHRLLGDVATFTKGKGLSKADIDENGETPCIRYGELYTVYGATIFDVKSKTKVNVANLVLSKANDVIIPASGETQIDIATASCVQLPGVALGGDLNIIRSKLDGVFLSYYLNSQKKLDIAKLAQGNSVVHLYSSQLKQLELKVPSSTEQTKIASFLTAVDEKLAQLTRKHDMLTQYKKGVMQQIFSQELRFKDNDVQEFPEWKECTIGEIATQKSKKLNPENAQDNLRCVELEHISQNTGQLLGYVDARKQKSLKSQFSKGDVLFGKLRPYLRKYLKAPFDGVCSTEIWVLRGSSVTNDFLFHYVQAERFLTVANISSGSKMPRADWNVVASEETEIPCKAEQTKIANFLTAIDEKITATKTQLEAVKHYKQGLLQQLFV
ncbi:MAG: restriction endonuclease subunit S [Gallionella sp.]|jgi:type I restriction enzyme S subunit